MRPDPDPAGAGAPRGFRLECLELLNWGTFHQRVATIGSTGANLLLTGDIGSGKSTLVDALTTLLVPHQRITYNKAAGAEGRERTLASYVRGAFRSTKNAYGAGAKAEYLRDESSYAVLLVRFRDAERDERVTLAQVFWMREGQQAPEKLHVVAEGALSIGGNFSGFGSDIRELGRRLRKTAKVKVYEHFSHYAAHWQRLFGIANEQAMQLFYQTVSMKQVGNLTDFVREHMLAAPSVEDRIRGLCEGFRNLNAAHDEVLRARRRIELLRPLAEEGSRHDDTVRRLADERDCREALDAWRAERRIGLLDDQLQRNTQARDDAARREERLRLEAEVLRERLGALAAAIEREGGGRLRDIAIEIGRLEADQQRQSARTREYQALARRLSLSPRADPDHFAANQARARTLLAGHDAEEAALVQRDRDLHAEIRGIDAACRALAEEIEALQRRRSNIPLHLIDLRAALCRELAIDEDELPFAGELIEVKQSESDWEPAIERLLRNFAQSLLVAEAHYPALARYVENTALRGRLVYYRTGAREAAPARPAADTVPRKLELRDGPYRAWLEARLAREFDHVCCADLGEFRRQPRALSRGGQFKSGGVRHEKDDRHDLHDRTRYVLGWNNEAKLLALKTRLREQRVVGEGMLAERAVLAKSTAELREHRDAARDLCAYAGFAEIDVWSTAARIRELRDERAAIEASSDALAELRKRHALATEEARDGERRLDEARQSLADLRSRIARDTEDREAAVEVRDSLPAPQRELHFPTLDALATQLRGERTIGLRNLDALQTELREALKARIDATSKALAAAQARLTRHIADYREQFPAEAADLDRAPEGWPEYAEQLAALQRDDLPRFEQRFRELLRAETINGVALFNANLEQAQRTIHGKIAEINASLRGIEYSPGTHVSLVVEKNPDVEIREFHQDLIACLSQGVEGEEIYSEAKFQQVRAIVERFNGREGLAEIDRRWTAKVTDVRQWFLFAAAERWTATGEEREYYSDSSGKSGGQKEKLAYTILASGLAYQFGLDRHARMQRVFRFVMIDEAFGRGSDESTRYALELFRRMDLQLLIVTPLQKIHVIEDYVSEVHFVHNDDGRDSRVHSLTIETFRERRAARRLEAAR
jgi:uncharacterized protein YPO0396